MVNKIIEFRQYRIGYLDINDKTSTPIFMYNESVTMFSA